MAQQDDKTQSPDQYVRDLDWQGAMKPEMERLKARGFRIQYKVEPNEPHLIQALQGAGVKRLFDQFESCK